MGIARQRFPPSGASGRQELLTEEPNLAKRGMMNVNDLQDEERRDLSDDLREATDEGRKFYNTAKRAKNLYNKFRNPGNDAGEMPKETESGGATGAGKMMPRGEDSEAAPNAAQAGGDLASNASSTGAPGGDIAAGANASSGGTAASTGESVASGGAAAGGAAAAEAGGAAAGSTVAAGGGAAGGAAAGGAAAGGAAAAPAIGIGCLVVIAVVVVIILIALLVYIITLPVNVLSYNADANGEGITNWSQNVGQDLSVSKYDFMIDMYELSSTFEDFAFHILHPGQAAATDAILNELEQKELSLANDSFAPEYTDTTNSIVLTLDGAFRKGWARTAQTAEYRAKQIVAQTSGNTHTVVDQYDSEELWNSDEYWADTSNWKRGDDYYIAGTFDEIPGETYRNQCADSLVRIDVNVIPDIDGDGTPDNIDDNIRQPSYLDAILKVITLQNCAEQGIILENGETGNIKQYGLDVTYTDSAMVDDEAATAEEKMKSTEYQLLRLAGEVAGRGIQRQDLNSEKEADSIYQIVTSTEIADALTVHDVQIQYVSGYHDEPVLDANGNYQYDENDELITQVVPEYSWRHDHYEVCVQIYVNTTYSVVLRRDVKDMIAKELTKSFTAEEKTAFYDSVDSYYSMQYELLCELYGIEPYAWDYGGGSNGGYQPGMTPEEIDQILGELNLDPASARGRLIEIALSSVGRFTYNQSNGFRRGVNSGLFSPGNVNYTGTEHDCSSFVQYCYFMAGIPLSPTNTSGYAGAISNGELIPISREQVQPGDLQVVYPGGSYSGHVWMYVGNGTWCECTPQGGVRADNWSANFMSSHPSRFVTSVFLQGA